MAPSLNSGRSVIAGLYALLVMSFLASTAFAQLDKNTFNHDDYKSKDQFEKFQKRRKVVGAWQINQLKEGALVVKLKNNKILIDELTKNGKAELAVKKRLEAYFINRNIMQAYKDNFDFCKVYFIYSSAGDSLLKGIRQGIFLDSTLKENPAIVMTQTYYLLAERDFVYNSSIGFVPEDSARYAVERGNPSGEQAEAVLKNKYGHQLKKPFPYVCGYGNKGVLEMSFVKEAPQYYYERGNEIEYTIDKTQLLDVKNGVTDNSGTSTAAQNPSNSGKISREFKKAPPGSKTFMLGKQYLYELVSQKIRKLNDDLNEYYRANPKPDVTRLDKELLQFLY